MNVRCKWQIALKCFICIVFIVIFFIRTKPDRYKASNFERCLSPPVSGSKLFRFPLTPRLPKSLQTLVVITSEPLELKRRQRLRQSWAKSGILMKYKASAMFSVGNQRNSSLLRQSYEREQAQYNDILFDELLEDSYYRHTRKVIGALYWVSQQKWVNLQYIIKTDSGFILPDFEEILPPVMPHSNVLVIMSKNWIVSKHKKESLMEKGFPIEYFRYNRIPTFAVGPTYALTLHSVTRLLCEETLKSIIDDNYVHIENVYITGILRDRCGIGILRPKDVTSHVENDSYFYSYSA